MTIERLPGTELTPTVLLAQLLEDADDFKAIIVIKEYKDDTMSVCWSRQLLKDVSFGSLVLQDKVLYEINNPPDESGETKDAS